MLGGKQPCFEKLCLQHSMVSVTRLKYFFNAVYYILQ